jgi:beta-lactam-binding protein with PASTA domain
MAQQGAQVFNDRYELVGHVARGGMAQVYLAKDLLLGRPVALKVLFPELSVDEAFVARFRREAQAAANLSHPNIVSIYDWGEGERTYFMVMEYVDEGRTLAQVIRQGPLPPEKAASIAADVAGALAFAHSNGVIHRDVKPGNVLMDQNDQVKVADFGIARAVGDQDGLTKTGAVMGTATYFSPEQAQGYGVDARSDIYSLGVVLYEMVTGRPPFAGENPVAIAYQHVREEPLPPRQVNPAVPPSLEAIILQAMAKDPAQRYQSAEDMRVDLARFLGGRSVLAVPPPPTPTATATRVQPVYDGTQVLPRSTGPQPRPPEPARERRTGAWIAILVLMLAVLAGLLYLLGRQLGVFKTSATKVAIPADIIGADAGAAQTELQNLGLKVTQTPNTTTDSASVGKVLDSNPKTGTVVAKNSTVNLIVGASPGQIAIPDVSGQDQQTATATLQQAGFHVFPTQEASDTVAQGNVIRTDPPAGSTVNKGSNVTLVVSTGKGTVKIPNEEGKDPAAAANALGNLGLTTKSASESSDTVPQGQVTRTDPPAGSSVSKGSTVTIYVSTGPQQVPVPNEVGQTQDAAVTALRQAGFQVTVTFARVINPARDGIVLSQDPNSGNAAKGSTVTIVVGQSGSNTTTTAPPP